MSMLLTSLAGAVGAIGFMAVGLARQLRLRLDRKGELDLEKREQEFERHRFDSALRYGVLLTPSGPESLMAPEPSLALRAETAELSPAASPLALPPGSSDETPAEESPSDEEERPSQ